MKAFKTLLKGLAFLAVIGGAVYVGITYRDTIIAWVKKVLKIDVIEGECCCNEEDCCCEGEACCCEQAEEAAAEEAAPAEQADFES